MWTTDADGRCRYFGALQPTAAERVLLSAHAEIHWLAIRTSQNLRAIMVKDRANAEAIQ
jgi:hypothetical protein